MKKEKEPSSTAQEYKEILEIMIFAHNLSEEDRLIFLHLLQDVERHESAQG